MRRLPLCFFLIVSAVPFAFADGTSSTVSRAIPSSASSSTATQSSTRGTANTVTRAQTSRTTTAAPTTVVAQPVTENSTNNTLTARDDATSSRTVVSRTTSNTAVADTSNIVRVGSRVVNLDTATGTSTTGRGNSTTVNSTGVSRASITQTANSARDNLEATVNTVGRNARVEAASINSNPAVRRAGLTLRPSSAEVGARAKIAGTDTYTGSNIESEIRNVQSRAATTTVPTTESIAEAKERLDLTSDLNTSCQQQYNDCMDQFCAVIDANQKRCSCSANLSNYARVEEAVTDANNQLNEVAQRIRYVGLSADEIRAIMTETEAEEALNGAKDTSETRNMLEEIEALIRDPSSASSSSSSGTTSFGLDMDLTFSSDVSDLFSLDFLNTGTTSFSNLRGTDLYNAAKNRCKTVLTQCEAAGANVDQITGNYDLAIDKDCIAYEQGLEKMNQTLVSNVRSANLMLQKARLAVLENKNQYDAKGCIAALDTCMTDDMVCGSDYTKCLDPTKKYIDENGSVVLGRDITNITEFMENYNNADISATFLDNAYKMSINETSCTADATSSADVGNNGACVVSYLLKKIGTQSEVTDEGLCRAVLDKCQAYTYDDKGNYIRFNDIVVNYIQRAMVNVQAQQRKIISDYASSCMVDIANCYNKQVTQVNAWSSSASVTGIYNVMRGACRNVALTCAYAVFDKDETSCRDDETCINSISEMFYQSLLCPDNSVYDTSCLLDTGMLDSNCTNEKCRCIDGYDKVGAYCYATCENGTRNSVTGACVCDSGYKLSGGVCIKDTTTEDTSGTGTETGGTDDTTGA